MKLILAKNISDAVFSELTALGFEIIKTPYNPCVMEGLNYHADMQVAKVDKVYVCEPSLYDFYSEVFVGFDARLICGKKKCSCNYPEDIAYNIKVIGNKVFHNFKHTDEVLKKQLAQKTLINVSQGYSGCSICKVSDRAIITSDRIIDAAAKEHEIDSLLISPGNIHLEGFDYGFIGGSSFCFDNRVYFFGDIKNHPDYPEIEMFCHKYGVGLYSLSSEPLTDYGSAITID